MDDRRNKPRVRPSTTSSAHYSQQVVPYCKYGIDESKTESPHRHMKLVTPVSEYRPIAMYSCRMTGTKLISSGYSPQRLRCFPRPKMTAFLWLALGQGIPHCKLPNCNSECTSYEVYSPCSLRQARSYCSTYTHPESQHIVSRCAIRDDGRSGQSSSTRARWYQSTSKPFLPLHHN
jgi:hypothetical protein